MSNTCKLQQGQCKPCEGGVAPLSPQDSEELLQQISDWELAEDALSISRQFTFKDFEDTMSFINAMADVARGQDHHPDFSAGYRHCLVSYTTHAIGGLSENDFICAAKLDELASQ